MIQEINASFFQVEDDFNLLTKMMNDMSRSIDLYRPTNYWSYYEKIFLPELRKHRLFNFRRKNQSILSSFGATDLKIKGQIFPKKSIRGIGRIAKLINTFFYNSKYFSFETNRGRYFSVTEYFYPIVKSKFEKCKLNIDKAHTTLFGNPEDIVKINGNYWTESHLCKCSIFIDSAKIISFMDDMIFCELGTGMGRNIEILANLYKDSILIMFDIPPQLYVAHQYLSKVFDKRVIIYDESVKLKSSDFKGNKINKFRGKIIILPTWKMPEFSSLKIDIFWNSASFQEMEPNIVDNYLNLVKNMKPRWIYINALPKGNYRGKWKPGKCGTKEPVTENVYLNNLKKEYKLVETYRTDYFLSKNRYKSYIFEKRHRNSK